MFEDTRDYFNSLLDKANIEYTIKPLFDGYQWRFPKFPNGDIVCHSGSYHNDEGYVESFGFEWDDGDVTALPPEEMISCLLGEKAEHRQTYDFFDLLASCDKALKFKKGE